MEFYDLFGKRKKLVGLDVGSGGVKVVKLNVDSDILKLEFAGSYSRFHDGERKELNQLLQEIFRDENLKRSKVAANFHAPLIHRIDIPKMPDGEIKEVALWEAAKILMVPAEAIAVDYYTSPAGDNKFCLNIIAAKRDEVKAEAKFLRDNGANVTVFDATPMAVLKVILFNYPDAASESNIAFVNIGHKKMEIGIGNRSGLLFYRQVKYAGHSITKRIMQVNSDTYQKNERLKCEIGLTGGKLDISALIEDEVDKILIDIRRSFDYYRSQYRDDNIGSLFLSGGSSMLPGLTDHIKNYFDLDVQVVDPFAKIDIEGELALDRVCFTASVGMALRNR